MFLTKISSKQEEEDESSAFLEEGLGAFGDLNLDDVPSSQELWIEILNKIDEESDVPDFFENAEEEAWDFLRDALDVCCETTGKREY